MKVHVEQEIDVASEEAFDAMVDVRNELRWNSWVTEAELVTAEPIEHGTKFRTVNRRYDYQTVMPPKKQLGVRVAPMDL